MATKKKTAKRPAKPAAKKPAKKPAAKKPAKKAKKATAKPAKMTTKKPAKKPAPKPTKQPAKKVSAARAATKTPPRPKKPRKVRPPAPLELVTVSWATSADESLPPDTSSADTLPTVSEVAEVAEEPGLAAVASIQAYKEALFMKAYLVGNGASVSSEDWRAFLRSFQWFSHRPMFQDLHDAASSALPVLGGYLMHLSAMGGSEHDVARLNKAMDVLATYLDQAGLELAEEEEPSLVISTALYDVPETLEKLPTSVLDIAPMVRAKNDELLAREGLPPGLRDLLGRSDADRVRALAERFQDVSTVKNCVYNMVRAAGEQLLDDIEATIYDLHPADQNYILHGLDAFPESSAVLAFYSRFLERNEHASLAKEVAKYSERVKAGKQTTGWET